MNKSDLIAAMATKAGVSNKAARPCLDPFLDLAT